MPADLQRSTIRIALAGCLLTAGLLSSACGSGRSGDEMKHDAAADTAWTRVTAATSAAEQRQQIDAFLASQQQGGAPPLMVNVAKRDGGAPAPIDDALWQNPQDYEVTLRYGERRYRFVPLSRSSLEPLFRE